MILDFAQCVKSGNVIRCKYRKQKTAYFNLPRVPTQWQGAQCHFWQNFQAFNSNLNLTVAAIDAIWAKWQCIGRGFWSWASAISTAAKRARFSLKCRSGESENRPILIDKESFADVSISKPATPARSSFQDDSYFITFRNCEIPFRNWPILFWYLCWTMTKSHLLQLVSIPAVVTAAGNISFEMQKRRIWANLQEFSDTFLYLCGQRAICSSSCHCSGNVPLKCRRAQVLGRICNLFFFWLSPLHSFYLLPLSGLTKLKGGTQIK